MKIGRWCTAVSLCTILCTVVTDASLADALDEAKEKSAIVAEFDVAKGGAPLILPVTIDGKEYPFAVGTEVRHTLFGTRLREILSSKTADGMISVGKLKLSTQSPIRYFDLENVRRVTGTEIVGFIGADSLRAHIVRIDFKHGKLAFLSAVPSSPGSQHRIVFPDGEFPSINVSLPGNRSERVVLGTLSNSALNVKANDFEEFSDMGFLGPIATSTVARDVGGRAILTTRRYSKLRHLKLGQSTYNDIVIHEGPANALGCRFLSQFVATFDFPEEVIYLKKSTDEARWNKWGLSGLRILRIDGKYVVDSVAKESPAALGGIRKGDLIHQIDGARANSHSLFELQELLEQKGGKVTLTIRRGNEDRRVKIVLREFRQTKRLKPN